MLPECHLFNNGTLDKEWQQRSEAERKYLVLTVVRNPWDRFVSGWKYLAATRDLPLLDVLQNPPAPETGHDYRHLTRPQLEILTDANGRFVPDYVLRFENLAADYEKFCQLIGKKNTALPRLNTTPHQPYQEYFDAPTLELFKRRFQKDVEFFGYDFSGSFVNPPGLAGRLLV